MLRSALVGLAATVLGTAFYPDNALAHRGGGARVGGGGVRAAGIRGVLLALRVVGQPIVALLWRGGYYPYRGTTIGAAEDAKQEHLFARDQK